MSSVTPFVPDTAALVGRVFTATLGALELFSIYLGRRLGLYEQLDGAMLTVKELAASAQIDERYAREWLEQQAVAGFLVVADDSGERRFSLPEEHRPVLVDERDPVHLAPFSLLVGAAGSVLPDLVDAYKFGGGVAFEDYGPDMREGQAAINRPTFARDLPSVWIPAMPDVHARLQADPPARIADVGCGTGWSSVALATGFPKVRVDGFDLDVASLNVARRNAAEAGVDDRVTFSGTDLADASLAQRYDLACIFEALHDMSRPVEVLAAIREMLAPGASLLVVDERVAEEFTAPGDEVERMMYGWSILHCLPAAMVDAGSAATGTVMRPGKLREYATAAGFTDVEILDVDNAFFRLYRLSG